MATVVLDDGAVVAAVNMTQAVIRLMQRVATIEEKKREAKKTLAAMEGMADAYNAWVDEFRRCAVSYKWVDGTFKA